MKFTQSQTDAIRHGDTNLQLIACAGSGKTEVVAQRVANLLKTGLKPRNIIAFTFTDKAAAELKDRIVTRCREAMGDVYGLAEMYVGTIHGFCLDLLMTEVHDALKFNVLNEVQQTLFIDRHSKASGLTTCTDLNGAPLRRYRDTNHYLSALNILREDEPVAKALAGSPLPAALDTYQALLDERRYFDTKCPQISEDPEEVIRRIADYRGDEKHENYARYTVEKAQGPLQRGFSSVGTNTMDWTTGDQPSETQRELP